MDERKKESGTRGGHATILGSGQLLLAGMVGTSPIFWGARGCIGCRGSMGCQGASWAPWGLTLGSRPPCAMLMPVHLLAGHSCHPCCHLGHLMLHRLLHGAQALELLDILQGRSGDVTCYRASREKALGRSVVQASGAPICPGAPAGLHYSIL